MMEDADLHMSIEELAEELGKDEGPIVIDVRERYEFETGAVPGARNVPLMELAPLFDDPDKTEAMVFICEVGVRSLQAAQFARIAGVAEPRSVDGGMVAWRAREDGSSS